MAMTHIVRLSLVFYHVYLSCGCVSYNTFYHGNVCCTNRTSPHVVCLPPRDDYSTEKINVNTNFDFFGNATNNFLYVATNGIISFHKPITRFTGMEFPQIGSLVMIAPFWADVDIRNAGSICYTETSLNDHELRKVQQEIRQSVPAMKKFTPTWMIVVTWCEVPAFPNKLSKRNTFQATIVTDRRTTFVIYNHKKIQWTVGSASGVTHAQVGFNKGDNIHFYSVEGSMTPGIMNLPQKSNIGQPGKFIFRVDLQHIEDDPENIECNVIKTDLIFLIDSSISEERHFQKMLSTIEYFVNNTYLGNLRIGIAGFSKYAQKEFSLNMYDDSGSIIKHLENIRQLNGTTNMEIGLRTARKMFNFYEGARSGAERYVIVLTDGLVSDRGQAEQEVRRMRSANIRVVVVSIGTSVSHMFLEKLVFNSSYVLNPNPESLLSLIHYEIHDPSCIRCSITHESDILFMIDRSSSLTSSLLYKVILFLDDVVNFLAGEFPSNDMLKLSIGSITSVTEYIVSRSNYVTSRSKINYVVGTAFPANYSNGFKFAQNHVETTQQQRANNKQGRNMVLYVTSCLIGYDDEIKNALEDLRKMNTTVYFVGVGCSEAGWTNMEHIFQDGYYIFDVADISLFNRRFLSDIRRIACAYL